MLEDLLTVHNITGLAVSGCHPWLLADSLASALCPAGLAQHNQTHTSLEQKCVCGSTKVVLGAVSFRGELSLHVMFTEPPV